jgi:hypothetical protein
MWHLGPLLPSLYVATFFVVFVNINHVRHFPEVNFEARIELDKGQVRYPKILKMFSHLIQNPHAQPSSSLLRSSNYCCSIF